jgi:hypothetical protein
MGSAVRALGHVLARLSYINNDSITRQDNINPTIVTTCIVMAPVGMSYSCTFEDLGTVLTSL